MLWISAKATQSMEGVIIDHDLIVIISLGRFY